MSICLLPDVINPTRRSRTAKSVVYRIWEQKVASSIPGSANIYFRGLMIVIVTRFIPLSTLPIVSTIITWESSQQLWRGKVRMVKWTPEKHSSLNTAHCFDDRKMRKQPAVLKRCSADGKMNPGKAHTYLLIGQCGSKIILYLSVEYEKEKLPVEAAILDWFRGFF